MPSWLLECARLLTGGAVGWPAYLLSGLCVVATYGFVFALGRDLTDQGRALSGALLLSGVLYFSWVTPEFNHNVLQMPFWAGLIFALWRARERNGIGWWALVGALGAVGLYAKISTVVLLIVATAYILFDPKCRRHLATRAPWIGLATFFVLVTPLVNWLVETDFLIFDYAEARAVRGRAGGVSLFVWKQIVSSAGLLLILAVASMPWRKGTLGQPILRDEGVIAVDARRFLTYFFFSQIVFAVLSAAIMGVGLKGSWGTSMLSLAGLSAVVALARLRLSVDLGRVVIGALALLVIIPAAYAASVALSDRFSKSPPRVAWPQAEIGIRLEQVWRDRTGQPLRYVVGDLWIGGMIAATASDRPSLLIDGNIGHSPWIDRAKIEKHGAMVVWWRPTPEPQLEFPHIRVLGIDGVEVFHANFGRHGRALAVYFAIVQPGTKMKLGALQRLRR